MRVKVWFDPMVITIPDPPDGMDEDFDLDGYVEEFVDHHLFMNTPQIQQIDFPAI